MMEMDGNEMEKKVMGNKRKAYSCSKKAKVMLIARKAKRLKFTERNQERLKISLDGSDCCVAGENYDSYSEVCDALISDLEKPFEEERNNTLEETNSIKDHVLELESDTSIPSQFQIEGRRLVDFMYFFNQLKLISNHNPEFGCSISNLQVIKEILIGLESVIHFKCNMCNLKFHVSLTNFSNDNMTVNHAAVTGTMLIGCGYTNLNELLTAIDLPNLNQKSYTACHNDVSKWWEVAAERSMNEAAIEESNLAIESGDIIDGIPSITVIADACWSKRSYRTNYSAASGAGAIIGLRTGKVIHMQVKNKYCIICVRSLAKNQPPPNHECTRNHTGSSSSMEQASIVEGFKTSVQKHNLVYSTLIADGDASTYKKILECMPYRNVQVQKIECSNHLLRNYCSKLILLQKDTSIPLSERKLLSLERINRLRTAIRSAARFRNAQNNSVSEKIIKLRDDIINSPKHVFGDHNSCEDYYCGEEKRKEPNLVHVIKILLTKIMGHTTQISLHSKSLLCNVNNNRAEQFNSIVAKHIGGKRINYSLKNSYAARCYAAVVAFNTGKPQYALYKANFNKSPKKLVKTLELRRCQRNIKRLTHSSGHKRKITSQNNKQDYGEQCQKPDLTMEQYEAAKEVFLKNLEASVENRHDIERDTVLQAESALWLELRRCLLTASSFSKICKRRPSISTAPLVKSIVYSYSLDNVPAIKYGKSHEKLAIEQLQKQEGIIIERCGLFIDKDHFFLGASPDGVYDESIVEIKCPYSARNMHPEEAIRLKKIKFWKVDGSINTNHDWYFQIQGQLNISDKNECLFAVWTGPDYPLKIAKILRDKNFWASKMKNKLLHFYEKCLLPEFVDPRKCRSMPIRQTNMQ